MRLCRVFGCAVVVTLLPVAKPLSAQVRTIMDRPKGVASVDTLTIARVERDVRPRVDTVRISTNVDTVRVASRIDTVRIASRVDTVMIARMDTVSIVKLTDDPITIDPSKVPQELKNSLDLVKQCASLDNLGKILPAHDQQSGECYWLQKGFGALQNAQLLSNGGQNISAVVEVVSRIVGPIRIGFTQAVSTGGDAAAATPTTPATTPSVESRIGQFLAGGGSSVFSFALPLKFLHTTKGGIPMSAEFHPTLRTSFAIPKLSGDGSTQTFALDSIPASAQISIDGQWKAGPDEFQAFGTLRGGAVAGTGLFGSDLGSTHGSFAYGNVTAGIRILGTYSFLLSRAFFSSSDLSRSRTYLTISTTQK